MSRRRRESGKGRKAGKQERPRLTVSAGSGEEPVERKRPVRVSYRDDGQWQVMQGEELIAVEPSLERAVLSECFAQPTSGDPTDARSVASTPPAHDPGAVG